MSALNGLALTICCVCIGAGLLSVLIPQKRTGQILSFVLGLFLLVSFCYALNDGWSKLKEELSIAIPDDLSPPQADEQAYIDAVAQTTADKLVDAMDHLLQNEGIFAQDIRISLRISEQGSIFVDRADIYITKAYSDRAEDIKSIVYRNLSKEPDVYVQKQEME